MPVYKAFTCNTRYCVLSDPFDWTLEKFIRCHEGHPQTDNFAATILIDVLSQLLISPFYGFSLSNILIMKEKGTGVRACLGFNTEPDPNFKAADGVQDTSTSVWSAGIMLYYILVGRSPW